MKPYLTAVTGQSNLLILRRLPILLTMFANNSSTNSLRGNNGTCFLPIDDVAVMISYTITYSILMLASLTGNSLLIYASVKSNVRMAVIIANMAASDIVFSIIHFPREIVFKSNIRQLFKSMDGLDMSSVRSVPLSQMSPLRCPHFP